MIMGIGKGGQGDFENFGKIGCFLNFEWEKQISPLLAPHGKIWEKSPSGTPLEKILPTPMPIMKTLVGLMFAVCVKLAHTSKIVPENWEMLSCGLWLHKDIAVLTLSPETCQPISLEDHSRTLKMRIFA